MCVVDRVRKNRHMDWAYIPAEASGITSAVRPTIGPGPKTHGADHESILCHLCDRALRPTPRRTALPLECEISCRRRKGAPERSFHLATETERGREDQARAKATGDEKRCRRATERIPKSKMPRKSTHTRNAPVFSAPVCRARRPHHFFTCLFFFPPPPFPPFFF